MRKTLATLAAGLLTAALAPAQMPPAVAPPPRLVETPAERQVYLTAMIVEMPVKVVDQFRRDVAAVDTDATKLNDVIRRLEARGEVEILSQPNLMLTDRQTGFFQVGQQFPVVPAGTAPQPVLHTPTGITFRVVPTIAADAKSVTLKTELEVASANPTPVDLGNDQTTTAVDTQATRTTLRLDTGKTIVVPSEIVKSREVVSQVRLGDGPIRFTLLRTEKTKVVLILTAETDPAKMTQMHLSQAIRPAVAVAPAAACGNCYAETQTKPRPVPVSPPVMAQACPVVGVCPVPPPVAAVAPPVWLPQPVPPTLAGSVRQPVVELVAPPVVPAATTPAEPWVTKVYPVLDLVTPIPDFRLAADGIRTVPADKPPTADETAAALVKMLITQVQPASWASAGGRGQVDYHTVGGALVVTNAPAVHARIEKVFAGLRQAQDFGTHVETRFVTVPAGFAADTKLFPAEAKTAFLSGPAASDWLKKVQAEPTAVVVQSPKFALFNGQSNGVFVGDVVSAADGPVVLGTQFQVQATVSADKKFVRLVCKGSLTGPAGPMAAVTRVEVRPVAEKSAFHTLTFDRTVAVPDGHTMAVFVGTKPVVTHTDATPLPFSRIPYLNRLFAVQGLAVEEREVIALVTPRVYCNADPVPQPVGELAGLLAEYKAAVAAGKSEEAMKFALKALAFDPGCFAK